jgi:formylmethanofuran dehydrogenase subunit B
MSFDALTPTANLERAVEQAAAFLAKARMPLIAGLSTDIAGAVAALKLAQKLGGVIDHASSESSLRDQAVLHDIGLMFVSPGEARQRADTFLIIGGGPLRAWPEMVDFLFGQAPMHASKNAAQRQAVAIASREPAHRHEGVTVRWSKFAPEVLPGLLAALRVSVNGRPLAAAFDHAEVDRLAELLKGARFGVAIWSPDELDPLTIEMLVGLIKDLNAVTRWSGLSISEDETVVGAAMACGWMTGLPLRTGFARGLPEHDPWRFDARRLVESGEADAMLWIGGTLPHWLSDVPAVVLVERSVRTAATAHMEILIGRPGVDHEAVLCDRRTGTLVRIAAAAPSNAPAAADVLTRIAEKLAPP